MRKLFKRALCLTLSALMLFGTVPNEGYAEGEMGAIYSEELGGEFNPFETQASGDAQMPAIYEEEPVYAADQSGSLFSEQDRQAVLHRQVGSWKFPVAEEYFDDIVDFAGCRGGNTDFFYGVTNYNCISAEHGNAAFGNNGMDINVPYGAQVFAPTDGTLYRSAWADSKLGVVAVIEHTVGNGFSYYVILSNINDDVPVANGSWVNAGDLAAYAYGRLHYTAVMAPAGQGSRIADNSWWELDQIASQGWLTENYGTGLICVNPSFWTNTSYVSSMTNFLDGPFQYTFVQPQAPVIPTEAPTEAPTQPAHTEHTWDARVVNREATHFTEGEIVYICSACGEQKVEALPKLQEHTFDQQNTAEMYLVSPASCQSGAVYAYSCLCGEKGTQTFTVGSASDHLWDGGSMTVQPTHTAGGEKTYTCTVCGATYKEPVASSTDHVYDQKNTDSRYLKSAPSCTSGAVYYMSCVCGEMGVETFTVGEALGHVFTDAWSTSETHHWHAAQCEHTSEVSGFGEHTWDAGKTTKEAGHVTDGEVTFTCTTCGLARVETVAGQPHVFALEIAAEKYLAAPATCTQGASYYKSCICGEKGTETFISGDAKGHTYSDKWSANETQHWQAATCEHTSEKIKLADHIWDGGVITVQPTATTPGERAFTCVVCKTVRKETLQPSAHEHTFAQTWTANDTYHWHAATCGHSNEMSGFGFHIWNGGVVTVEASHYSSGEKLYTCVTCGATKRETVAALHVFDQRIAAAQFMKTPASCTSPAVYYVSCSCGAKGTETFAYGATQGHTLAGTWSKDDTYHWRSCLVCGSKGEMSGHYFGTSNVCITCGYSKQESHVHSSHLGRVPAKSATCVQPGNIGYYICECGKWFTDTTAMVEITDRNSVVTPATGHVDKDNNGKCDICKELIATDDVSYTMTEGKDATWLNNASQGLVFRSNSDYSKFDHVEVDGSTISSMNYTISSGSTIVELSANYMKRLNVGQHTISIVARDGRATANFTIKQATAAAQEKGGSVVWVVVAVVAILAMIAAACVGGYLWYTNRTPKKGGKFSR